MNKQLGLILLLLGAASPLAADAYRIEMVIFEQYGTGDDEIWRHDDDGPDLTKAVGDLSGHTTTTGWLGPAAYTLNRHGHPILKHLAWTQNVENRASQRWLKVTAPGLQGLVRVTKGRYLHLDIDFLAKGEFRATAKRRMRSAQVHYIDHPRVGILVRIDPHTPMAQPTKQSAGQ